MKRSLITLVALLYLNISFAQLPNSSFENLTSEGAIRNWMSTTLLAIAIDSNGNSDSVLVDEGFYFSTNDAHSGLRAMEMRNAYNFTAGEGFAGGAQTSLNDSEYAFFQPFIPVTANPVSFGFYYKYFPVDNEFAMGTMNVFDSLGDQIGNVTIAIVGTAASYNFISAPVIYTNPGVAASATVTFRTCIPTQSPALGTRFIVDDVAMTTLTGVDDVKGGGKLKMTCFPSIVHDLIHITLEGTHQQIEGTLYITDVTGKSLSNEKINLPGGGTVSLQVNDLPSGVYFVQFVSQQQRLTGRFMK